MRSLTEKPRAWSSAPSAADARPLPREETTPPVMKMYRAMELHPICIKSRLKARKRGFRALWITQEIRALTG